jgi:hypothetical protein
MDFNLKQSMDILARTPRSLESLLDNLSEPWIGGTEGPNTFSAFDVIGHLIDGEETDWIPRARIILSRSADPRFEPYDRFRHRTRNVGRSLLRGRRPPRPGLRGCCRIVTRFLLLADFERDA